MNGVAKYRVTEKHREFVNGPRQGQVLELRLQGKTIGEISRELGMQETNVSKALQRIFQNARDRGYDPTHELESPLPENQRLAGVTNLYRFVDGKRELSAQYILGRKPKGHDEAQEIIEAIENAVANIKPCKPIPSPRKVRTDLCNLLHVTDYHLAMYASAHESDANWDTKIARDEFVRAITDLTEAAPPAGVGIFSQGGDFLHYDSLESVTPQNKHQLDSDTRAFQMVELALDMHIFAIDQMLRHHRRVVAIIQEGNHDPMSSIWLRKSLKRYYANNKRVEVLDINFPYYAYLHGEIMLAFHHGHRKKNKDLPALFASEPRYRDTWGKSRMCYIHTGHYHQREQDVTEYGGAVVERHPTLAARDAYAVGGGYTSWRAMNCITYHKTRGEVSRRTTVPSDG